MTEMINLHEVVKFSRVAYTGKYDYRCVSCSLRTEDLDTFERFDCPPIDMPDEQ